MPDIDIQPIRDALAVLAEFNSLDLATVRLLDNGQPISIAPEKMDEWRFLGMSNRAFVELEWWNSPGLPANAEEFSVNQYFPGGIDR